MTASDFLQRTGLSRTGKTGLPERPEGYRRHEQLPRAFRDAEFGLFGKLALSNQAPLANDLRDLDGYEDLFERQDYCDCEDGRSGSRPAAYFTDLMYFVQEHVSKKVFVRAIPRTPSISRTGAPISGNSP